MKKCSKCGELKEFECFSRHKRNKDGLQYNCKKCAYDKFKEWIEKNPEKWKIAQKKQDKKKLEKNPKYFDDLIDKTKHSLKERRIKHYEKHMEKKKDYSMAWYKKNIDYARKKQRDYRRKSVSEISKNYVANKLCISIHEVTDDIYELKKEQLQIYRLTKQLNEEIKNGTK